jgi:transketolase
MNLKKEYNKFQRDIFIKTLQDFAIKDKKIILISNDQGAPALDDFKKKIPKQFINAGISEQNIISVAAGLAKEGYNCFVYSIASFILYRAFEQIKIDLCSMKLPVKIIGVGSGYSYAVDGPTHHATEDIGILNLLPNMHIYSPSDSYLTMRIAKAVISEKSPVYLRLDRELCPEIYKRNFFKNFSKGFCELVEGKTACIISTGKMVSRALEISNEFTHHSIAVIDLYKIKPLNHGIISIFKKYRTIFCLEEHSEVGGIGSILLDFLNKNSLRNKVKFFKLGLKQKYIFGYGSRNFLHEKHLIDKKKLKKIIFQQISKK